MLTCAYCNKPINLDVTPRKEVNAGHADWFHPACYAACHAEPLTTGEIVTIKPEYRDKPDDDSLYVCRDNEEKGRVSISPVDWEHGSIVPVETVQSHMVVRYFARTQ